MGRGSTRLLIDMEGPTLRRNTSQTHITFAQAAQMAHATMHGDESPQIDGRNMQGVKTTGKESPEPQERPRAHEIIELTTHTMREVRKSRGQ